MQQGELFHSSVHLLYFPLAGCVPSLASDNRSSKQYHVLFLYLDKLLSYYYNIIIIIIGT